MCFLSLVINSLLYSHISINGYKNTQHHSLHISYQHHGPGVHKTIKSALQSLPTWSIPIKHVYVAITGWGHWGWCDHGQWTWPVTRDQPPMRQQRHKQFGSKSTSSGEYQYIMSIQRSAGSRALIQWELLIVNCSVCTQTVSHLTLDDVLCCPLMASLHWDEAHSRHCRTGPGAKPENGGLTCQSLAHDKLFVSCRMPKSWMLNADCSMVCMLPW